MTFLIMVWRWCFVAAWHGVMNVNDSNSGAAAYCLRFPGKARFRSRS